MRKRNLKLFNLFSFAIEKACQRFIFQSVMNIMHLMTQLLLYIVPFIFNILLRCTFLLNIILFMF